MCRALLDVGHVVGVAPVLEPALSVSVRAVRAASEAGAPPTLQPLAVLQPLIVEAGVPVLPVEV